MAYLITYDLCKPGQNYEGLIKAIKNYNCCRIAESAWVITGANSSVEIRDYLKTKIDKNDKLFVARLTGEAAWYGETDAITKWLKEYL